MARSETVSIDKLSYGGSGIGRLDGKVCFVPYTAPGDTAGVRIVSEKRSYCEGELLSLPEPSPLREQPACPVFGRCGGCQWQHLAYAAQLEAKEQVFRETLLRSRAVQEEQIRRIVPAPHPLGYRSRIQLKIYARGGVQAGFYARGSHFVVDFGDGCPLASPAINAAVERVRRVLQRFPDRESVPQVDLAAGEGEEATFIFHYIGADRDAAADCLRDATALLAPASGIYLQCGRKSTLLPLAEGKPLSYLLPVSGRGEPLRMTFGPGCFSQVNLQQNREMVGIATRWAMAAPGERVLDLFCGNGNFSLPLALSAGEVTGWEGFAPSIASAVKNAAANAIGNAAFAATDTAAALRGAASRGERFDLVLLDPPRTGAAEEVKLLPLLKPERIVYVSCDPPTLARDLGTLAKGGYEVVKTRPIDMFPQTYHIESVTLLQRS